jgi:hypothetical protein
MIPTVKKQPAGLPVAHCCSAVSKRGETDKHLYLQLESVAVSPFHGFWG